MTCISRPLTGSVLFAAAVLAGCGGPRLAPPVVAEPSTTGPAVVPPRRHVDADVRFMQRMIEHHDQALAMTALVASRAASADVRLMAERIDVSQRDEIARMRQWLVRRGEEVPALEGGHDHHSTGRHSSMPGMLTPNELRRLAETRGAEFDRLFLEYMIRHHEGALVMVAELFATDGAGQELDVFRLASEVDADQRAEIRRMRLVHQALSTGGSPP